MAMENNMNKRPMMSGLSPRAAFAAALVAATSLSFTVTADLAAQGTLADYQRGERLLNWNTNDLVAGDQVNPNWMNDGNRFWYRNNTGSGAEFMLVDPVRGTRGPVFDHARLAAAMSLANDTSYVGYKLPFQSFDFTADERAIEFNASKKRFRCTLATYACSVGDTLPNVNRYVGSPDSTMEAFYSGYNLWVRTKGGTDSTQLTTDGEKYWSYGASEARPFQTMQAKGRVQPPRAQVRWSPDSKKLIVYRTDERSVAHMPYVSYTSQRPQSYSQPYALPGDSVVPVPNLHVIDVATKRNVALNLTPSPNQLSMGGSPIDSIWAPDSKSFRFHYLTRASKSIYLIEADAETGATRILAKDTARTWVETNPQGRPSWAVTRAGDVIWWSERDGWPHLWRFDARTAATSAVSTESGGPGTSQNDGDEGGANGATVRAFELAAATSASDPVLRNQITAGAWATGDVHFVDEAKRQLYFTARGREDDNIYYAKLYRTTLDGAGMELLTPEKGNHNIRFSPSGRYIVDTYSQMDVPPVTVVRSAVDGRVAMKLEEADVGRLEEIGWTPPKVFTVKARDGLTDIYGVMFLPSNFDATKSYPIIDHIYPGPQVGSVGQWAWSTGGEERALAELGFIVVEIDHLGTPLRSKAFHDNYYGFFGDNGLPDHIAGIKQLAARHSYIDIDRVGIYGHSGGGFASTDAILRYPDFFKVAVSGAGNHDNRSYNIYWAEKYQGLMKKDTSSGKDNFDGSANKTMAANLRGRLLLMHGDMDDNVHPAMTIQLVNELIKANKDFDLIIAPDRAHGLNEPYFVRRRWDYFVRHLLFTEPPREFEIRRPSN
jgi:dipeptidyl aminopeptidase/acylaminoacyl peptidase